jgi:hypothetical protein
MTAPNIYPDGAPLEFRRNLEIIHTYIQPVYTQRQGYGGTLEDHIYINSGGSPQEHTQAAQGNCQTARNTSMHQYTRKQLAGLAPSLSRKGHAGCHLINDLFIGVSSTTTPPSRDPSNLTINSRDISQPSGPSHNTDILVDYLG